MPQGLDNFIGAVGDAIKTAPTFYEDALQPTVQETGKILALIPQIIEAALLPLRKWNVEREYKFAETKKLLEHKLENIDPEKIVTPESYVAVPAIQAISYSMDSEELRNLYANLLAKAMNSDTKDHVHPSFVEIIKQMSPDDALILKEISKIHYLPLVDMEAVEYESNNLNPIQKMDHIISKYSYPNVTYISFTNYETILISLDNLLRLRLIEERFSTNQEIPPHILESTTYLNHKSKLQNYIDNPNWEYNETLHSVTLSFLGINFCNICI